MRILIAEWKQETATFNPWPTRYEDFQIFRGRELLEAYAGTRTELSGAFDALREDAERTPSAEDVTFAPALAASAVSGGPVAAADFLRLWEELCRHLQEQAAGGVDGALLCLHGAMAAENECDPEGRLLAEVRRLIGESTPLVATLDLHAVLTDRMVAAADVLVPYHTYPHIDHYETGQRAARRLLQLIARPVRPTAVRIPLPMLVRGDELLTATGKFGQAIEMCREFERSADGLAAGVLIGNAFTDVPDLQSNVLVTTSGDPRAATAAAERIAEFMWERRRLFQAELESLERAIDIAESTEGLVVFSDAADATGSGAAGDSNAILRGLVARGFRRRTLAPIVDSPAVVQALEIGVGGEAEFQLGGTRDPRFQPLPLRARVRSLHDGEFTYEDGTPARAGRAAVLVAGPLHVLVTERPVFVVGRRLFQSHGLEPTDFSLVVVKSPNGFRTHYESIASRIVAVDVPGATSANLHSLPYRHCVRPIFPLDEHATRKTR